jgi:hypothetical protein
VHVWGRVQLWHGQVAWPLSAFPVTGQQAMVNVVNGWAVLKLLKGDNRTCNYRGFFVVVP